MWWRVVIVSCLLLQLVLSADEERPEVTLSHGGSLRGIRNAFADKEVDVYLGIRYAQAPVDELRFRKPVAAPVWTGTIDATEVGQNCPQSNPIKPEEGVSGQEDCLFLDITLPSGTKVGDKKSVMVFIHGGGYSIGSRSIYIGAGLATHGDVIVVSINYRLGILGLLWDEFGGGNMGMWDQREAFIWVQKNIAAFGGDPDSVTIFGESAGAGSVSAQTMGKHNNGLFKRAITQSGSLYMMFDHSKNTQTKIIKAWREVVNCPDTVASVYDCFRDVGLDQMMNLTNTLNMQGLYMLPIADGDFFPDSVETESYDLAHRFDLMAGVNGQEGGLMYGMEVPMIAGMLNKSTENGVDMEIIDTLLNFKCSIVTPLSPELCATFMKNLYKLEEPTCDKERARRLCELQGETLFNFDTLHQLEQHSSSDKSTYGYLFTENYQPDPPNPLWTVPDWLKTQADHGDELAFVFGATLFKSGRAKKDDLWERIMNSDAAFADMFVGNWDSDKNKDKEIEYEALSRRMMTAWTNFAKTGNPNKPVALDIAEEWPQFTNEEAKFMELNLNNPHVIDTPHRERLHSYKNHIMTARRRMVDADRPSSGPAETDKTGGHDEL